ncbi:NmrA family NAD(P)-binding protein [Phyllobacterium bourgognense]|uniref:Uncharacterized protein YbjT (DUF2867 family) n=1 Tax=Phyllobacterium bourgognense TaxID=314236 RepID=A0A368Z5G1_9HYPH|nr:NmrA family NAD(P)-binding protein [Phyllobacterium bourgognense]RCW86477.1 uncharacterized protein YbjT (DUF2867 family) [Phyllobacterium bourgognense]
MFIVLGATGHVGSEVANALLADGESVTVVTRSEKKARDWQGKGANAAIVDALDRERLAAVFRRGKRAFLLNPPAAVSTDTDVEEHETVQAIVAALDGSGLEKIVVESTYGAQPGERCGDLNVLYDFEQALTKLPIPVTVQRAAYYMSNWDAMLKPASGGTLPSMFQEEFVLPMVAPADLGKAAARFLREPPEKTGIHYVEGPQRYSIGDVARAFSNVLGKPVKVVVTPREGWVGAYRKLGFSEAAARSYARMTGATLDGAAMPDHPVRGTTSLQAYIAGLVHGSHHLEKAYQTQ